MGLDTYAYHKNPITGEKERMPNELFASVTPVLCNGIFSGGGASEFRGKVYAGFLFDVCNLDLYQEEIQNENIEGVADEIEEWLRVATDADFGDGGCEHTREELEALRDWFRVVHSNGGFVVGWW